jgi:membrane protein YdbS with pleckstrin-like domain
VSTDLPPERPAHRTPRPADQPSLVPGTVLLAVAAVLIVLVLVKPDMPGWLRTVIAVLAVLVVIALLVIAFRIFRGTTRRIR